MKLTLSDVTVMHNATQLLENLGQMDIPHAQYCKSAAQDLRRLVFRAFMEVERGIQASDAAGLENGKTGG